MKIARISLGVIGLLVLILLIFSGPFLVINQPKRSDVIVVLAGETEKRPQRGLELLMQGMAPRLILDVPNARIYQWDQVQLAQKYIQGLPQAEAIGLCPIHARSTKGEAQDVSVCLHALGGAHRVLLVTSDFHTRRTLSTFRRMLPSYDFSVAAAFDEREFGSKWWQRRQWAKVNFDEWVRLMWWEVVERWR